MVSIHKGNIIYSRSYDELCVLKQAYVVVRDGFIEEVTEVLDDKYKGENEDIKIDYIHGEDSLKRICAEKNGIGIVLPKLNKNDFFEYASKNRIMPKKTFSIGEANEKRYYIEARKIK